MKNFPENFREYIRMENPNHKNKNIERKYLKNTQKNQFLKENNSLLELKKTFYRTQKQRIKRQRSKNQKKDRRAIF